jgi:hypothetical protein
MHAPPKAKEDGYLDFPAVAGKEVTARFDGGDITSDAGALLLSQADRKLGLVKATAENAVVSSLASSAEFTSSRRNR